MTFIIIMAGCSASTSPNGTTTTPGSMVATVNGKAWSSAVVPGGITGGATATRSQSGVVTVTGVSTDLTEITIELKSPHMGSDSLGILSGDFGAYSEGILDTSSAWISTPTLSNFYPGSVTITTFDTTNRWISGQFHFVGRKPHNQSDTATVSNGSFYQVEWSK
jgi:hypothetical protein